MPIKPKNLKKLDEINGVKVVGRGYIASSGNLAGEFYSPYIPLDQGFSFYDEYAKIPIMEYEGEEFSVFEEYTTGWNNANNRGREGFEKRTK